MAAKYDPIADIEKKAAAQNRRAEEAKAQAVKGMQPQKVSFFYRLWHFLGCVITLGVIVAVIALAVIYGPGLAMMVLQLFGG